MAEAEKTLQEVAQHGNGNFASLAKFSLAQIYYSDGRDAQGEAILRDLMDHPTTLVSKEQATITLARYLMIKRPAEARKLLDPLRPSAARWDNWCCPFTANCRRSSGCRMLEPLRFPVAQAGAAIPEPAHPYRNPFQRDRDRIVIHAPSPPGSQDAGVRAGISDHFRNR